MYSVNWLPIIGSAPFLLGPVILALVIATSHTHPRRTVFLLAGVSLVLLILGAVGFVTHADQTYYITDSMSWYDQTDLQYEYPAHIPTLAILANAALLLGEVLSLSALVLAVDEAAHHKRWRWAATLSIVTLISGVAAVAAYNKLAAGALVITPAVPEQISNSLSGPIGDFSPFSPWMLAYVVWSVLVIVSPVAALLYAGFWPSSRAVR